MADTISIPQNIFLLIIAVIALVAIIIIVMQWRKVREAQSNVIFLEKQAELKKIELVEIECEPGDLVENDDFEDKLLKAGRGRIIDRKKFRDLDALLAWVKRELGD